MTWKKLFYELNKWLLTHYKKLNVWLALFVGYGSITYLIYIFMIRNHINPVIAIIFEFLIIYITFKWVLE